MHALSFLVSVSSFLVCAHLTTVCARTRSQLRGHIGFYLLAIVHKYFIKKLIMDFYGAFHCLSSVVFPAGATYTGRHLSQTKVLVSSFKINDD